MELNDIPMPSKSIESPVNNQQKQNKRKSMIITFSAIAGLLIVAFVVGLLSGGVSKTFTIQDMKITLTEDFEEDDSYIGFITAYISQKAVTTVTKESFTSLAGSGLGSDSTTDAYAENVMNLHRPNTDSMSEITKENNITTFNYTATAEGTKFYYRAYIYKTEDSFWMIQFICKNSQKSSLSSNFTKWAKSVTFQI